MAEKRNINQEIVKQCGDYFNREQRYWQRLITKRRSISTEEVQAKKRIIEAIYRVGAAAAIEERNVVIDDLLWDFKELKEVSKDYEKQGV